MRGWCSAQMHSDGVILGGVDIMKSCFHQCGASLPVRDPSAAREHRVHEPQPCAHDILPESTPQIKGLCRCVMEAVVHLIAIGAELHSIQNQHPVVLILAMVEHKPLFTKLVVDSTHSHPISIHDLISMK